MVLVYQAEARTMTTIKSFFCMQQAEMLKLQLELQGIPAFLPEEYSGNIPARTTHPAAHPEWRDKPWRRGARAVSSLLRKCNSVENFPQRPATIY